MPSSSSRPASHRSGTPTATIDKLEYKPGGRPLLRADHDRNRSPSARPSTTSPSYAGSFFEQVVEGVMDKDRSRMTREATRYFAFAWAIVNCLCAGSITAYSLYAPLFQKRLGYTQLQVNGVSITAELAMYLPVPLFGVLCDRYGPGPPSLLAGVFFGVGYILAAFAYSSGPPASAGGDGWPYAIMVLAFIPIGMGTSCMYLSAVTTCAKNFGRGKYKGIALALPIAAFGLSGMWQSQIGSRILYEELPDGSKGPVDVYRFFVFLGSLFFVVGVIGCFALRVVGEEELIDEAVDELERSGLLEESEFFRRRAVGEHYGTMSSNHSLSDEEIDELQRKAAEHQAQLEEEYRKKNWLLNAETRYFLADHTMWWLAAGFFLVTGPEGGNPTSAATHVSIVAVTSTLARILTGTLTDILAPTAPQHQHRRGPRSLENSMASLPPQDSEPSRFQLSRVTFLLAFALLCSLGQILLATGIVQEHAERFWLVSACIGAGYGATFSLTPIVVSVVWGVENFGTNWGIVATVPAIGATVWGLAFAGVYQRAAGGGSPVDGAGDVMCYGMMCYMPTFWAMAVSVWVACGLWFWAWRGKGGWVSRGILV